MDHPLIDLITYQTRTSSIAWMNPHVIGFRDLLPSEAILQQELDALFPGLHNGTIGFQRAHDLVKSLNHVHRHLRASPLHRPRIAFL